MKKKVIIGVALALVLASVGGGLAYANSPHDPPLVHKLIGVGQMGTFYDVSSPMWTSHGEGWDTSFIVTNPDWYNYIYIDYLAVIDSYGGVIYEGTPEDWWYDFGISIPSELGSFWTWQLSIAELLGAVYGADWWTVVLQSPLDEYTVEISWHGVTYGLWLEWRYARPLSGLAKELCWYETVTEPTFGGMVVSETNMVVFPGNWLVWGPGTETATVTLRGEE